MAKKLPAGTKDIGDPAKLHKQEEVIVPGRIGQTEVTYVPDNTSVHPPYPILGARTRLASLPLGRR